MVASSIASVASETHSEHSDAHTHASSTLGTTASLSSRIASLALESLGRDVDALSSLGGTSEGLPASCCSDDERELHEEFAVVEEGEDEEEEEEEEVVELTEEQLIQMLDSAEDPFQVCRRLFRTPSPDGTAMLQLKHLSEEHLEQLRTYGFAVVEGFTTLEMADDVRSAALTLSGSGELRAAAELDAGERFSDRSARSDLLCFINPNENHDVLDRVLKKMHELQEDLALVLHLRHRAEYQLAHYQSHGTFYKRHRDALPCDTSEDDQRRVTAILYTSSPWDEGDGGSLRLWPPRQAVQWGSSHQQRGVIEIQDLRSHTNRYEENGDRHIDGNGHSNCNGHLAADDLSSRASTGSSISSLEAGEWICRREGCACQQTSSCELRLSCICPLMRRWDTMSFATKGRTVSASQLKRGFGLGRRRFGTVAALH